MKSPRISCLFCGAMVALSFAPLFIFPFLILFSVLAFLIKKSRSYKESFILGYLFGFGYFFVGLYWVSIGVSVYSEKFWWAIPLSLLLLPAFFALYTGLFAMISYWAKDRFYIVFFVATWIISELLRTYLFTGFPWLLVGYSLSFSEILIQITSIIGSYGLGIIALFSGLIFYYLLEKQHKIFTIFSIFLISIWVVILQFGYNRLVDNPTEYSQIKVRAVQASIKQTEKWSIEKFWENFESHKELSVINTDNFNPDIVIWPEAAVTIQPTYLQIYNALKSVVYASKAILVTGGVTDNLANKERSRDKLFASIYAINKSGEMIFDYHKSHLVPFGEYVPLSNILPVDKLTPGSVPYDSGESGFIVTIEELNLKIRPLLCYEIIFPSEVRMSNTKADVIFNLTNDAYYGVSSGPYQHFYMTRMRAVENGLPIIRVANNGITATIDPLGRISKKTELNQVTYVDSYIPMKLLYETFYSKYGELFVYLYILVSIFISMLNKSQKQQQNNHKS